MAKIRVYYIIIGIIIVNIFGPLVNEMFKVVGLPPLLTPLKFVVELLPLMFYKSTKNNNFSLVALFVFVFFYLSFGIIQGTFTVALYYLRLYVIPMLIFLSFKDVLVDDYRRIMKGIILIFGIYSFFGILSFILVNFTSLLDVLRKDESFITDNWYVALTKIIRSGIPIGCPNKSGTVQSMILFIMVVYKKILYDSISRKRVYNVIFTLLFMNLILSFSKSAIGGFVIFYVLYLIINSDIKVVVKSVFFTFIFIALLFFVIPEDERIKLMLWLDTITSLSDSSSIGHIDSLSEGFKTFLDNWFYGVSKGSVGTKAALFLDQHIWVESSLLLIFIDFGVLGGVLYLIFWVFNIFQYKISVNLLLFVALLLPTFIFLPMILELEVMNVIAVVLPLVLMLNEINRGKVLSYEEKIIC